MAVCGNSLVANGSDQKPCGDPCGEFSVSPEAYQSVSPEASPCGELLWRPAMSAAKCLWRTIF